MCAPGRTASARSRPSQSPDSQIGPTTSNTCGSPWPRSHSTIRIQAPYIAGRARSFIAASTMQKFLVSPGLT